MPSERERRIRAASDALQLKVAAHAMKGIDDWPALVEAALDAADEAVPMVSVDALLADDAAMLALSEAAWEHAGTAMPRSAEGGREGLLAALASFSGEEGTEG